MASRFGRFTVCGSEAVEARITAMVDEAVEAVRGAFDPKSYRALLMIGGYGRGEGGVVVVNGEERPHNNIDFLLIANTASPKQLAALRAQLVAACAPVMHKHAIEIDLSVVSVCKLRLSPSLIIWYDARFGHKTLLGDAAFMPAQRQFRLERIPPRDALRLLVNRGTLLLINEHLLASGELDDTLRQRAIRNAMKAIIGYGDALLFFLGDYDWSYVERKQRMPLHSDVDPAFRALYEEATSFRFQPNYDAYAERDLAAWMTELRAALKPVHRRCEALRLGVDDLDCKDYPRIALGRALTEDAASVRAWARKARSLLRSRRAPVDAGLVGRLAYRAMSDHDRYTLAFPVAAYGIEGDALRAFAAGVMDSEARDPAALRAACVLRWCERIDINALSTLRQWRPDDTDATSTAEANPS